MKRRMSRLVGSRAKGMKDSPVAYAQIQGHREALGPCPRQAPCSHKVSSGREKRFEVAVRRPDRCAVVAGTCRCTVPLGGVVGDERK